MTTADIVAKPPIFLLPADEQTEIVRRVESLFPYADRRYAAARARVDEFAPATLAKAFRGELVPQIPDDEPSSVLLERNCAQRGEQVALLSKRGPTGFASGESPA